MVIVGLNLLMSFKTRQVPLPIRDLKLHVDDCLLGNIGQLGIAGNYRDYRGSELSNFSNSPHLDARYLQHESNKDVQLCSSSLLGSVSDLYDHIGFSPGILGKWKSSCVGVMPQNKNPYPTLNSWT